MPITALSNKNVGPHTFDDILSVVAWSCTHLYIGTYPAQRHDEADWRKDERPRAKKADKSLGVRGVLAEVRGDWKFMKDIFHLPGWNEQSGCCWRCNATPDDIRTVDAQAAWRQPENRLSHIDVLNRMLAKGEKPSPLMSAPHVTTDVFKIDWLHCADHGVTQGFLANALVLMLPKFPGSSNKVRCRGLWARIQQLYGELGVEDRMTNLTYKMLVQPNKSPTLRGSAAHCRALVPLVARMSRELFVHAHPRENACKAALQSLEQCYDALSGESADWHEVLPRESRKFAAQAVALETSSRKKKHWRVKPKMHIFLELCCGDEKPSLFWAYRDEDFGGTCARLARRRGGLLRPRATSGNVLGRFLMKSTVPRIL